MKFGMYDTTKFTDAEAQIYGRGVMDCMAHLHNQRMDAKVNDNKEREAELDNAQNSLWYIINRMKEQRGEKPIT